MKALGMSPWPRQLARPEPALLPTRHANAVSGEESLRPEETTATSPFHSGSPSSSKAIQSSSPVPAREQSGHRHHGASRYSYAPEDAPEDGYLIFVFVTDNM